VQAGRCNDKPCKRLWPRNCGHAITDDGCTHLTSCCCSSKLKGRAPQYCKSSGDWRGAQRWSCQAACC